MKVLNSCKNHITISHFMELMLILSLLLIPIYANLNVLHAETNSYNYYNIPEKINEINREKFRLVDFPWLRTDKKLWGEKINHIKSVSLNTLYIRISPEISLDKFRELLSTAENKGVFLFIEIETRNLSEHREWHHKLLSIINDHKNHFDNQAFNPVLLNYNVQSLLRENIWAQRLIQEWLTQHEIELPVFYSLKPAETFIWINRDEYWKLRNKLNRKLTTDIQKRIIQQTSLYEFFFGKDHRIENITVDPLKDEINLSHSNSLKSGGLVLADNPTSETCRFSLNFTDDSIYPLDLNALFMVPPHSEKSFLMNYHFTEKNTIENPTQLLYSTADFYSLQKENNRYQLIFLNSKAMASTVFSMHERPQITSLEGNIQIEWISPSKTLYIKTPPSDEIQHLTLKTEQEDINLIFIPEKNSTFIWPIFEEMYHIDFHKKLTQNNNLHFLVGPEWIRKLKSEDYSIINQPGYFNLAEAAGSIYKLELTVNDSLPTTIINNKEEITPKIKDSHASYVHFPESNLKEITGNLQDTPETMKVPSLTEKDWFYMTDGKKTKYLYDDSEWQNINKLEGTPIKTSNNYLWLRGYISFDQHLPKGIRINSKGTYSLFLNGLYLGTASEPKDFDLSGLFQLDNVISLLYKAEHRADYLLEDLEILFLDRIEPDYHLNLDNLMRTSHLHHQPNLSPEHSELQTPILPASLNWVKVDLPDYWLGSQAWYRENFYINLNRNKYFLNLETIEGRFWLYLNNKLITSYESRETSDKIDITHALEQGYNELAVFIQSTSHLAGGIASPVEIIGTNSYTYPVEWRTTSNQLKNDYRWININEKANITSPVHTIDITEIFDDKNITENISFWFKTSFTLDSQTEYIPRLFLNLEGINHEGQLYLNEEHIYNISKSSSKIPLYNHLNPQGDNILTLWLWNTSDLKNNSFNAELEKEGFLEDITLFLIPH